MFKKFTQSGLEEEALFTTTPGRIFCRRCDALVTRASHAVRIDGRHNHRRSNPAGIEFSFRCFSAAPGCRREGVYTTEYSWFTDSAWCFLTCGRCGAHLGWHFRGARPCSALITERLRYEHAD